MPRRPAAPAAPPLPAGTPPPAISVLPVLLLLFVGSGACALIYEVVWFQLLELVVGSTAISIGVLLATYMGGMCIGSLAFPRYVPKTQHPLRLYALLELSIGAMGLVELALIPLIGRLYSPILGHGLGAIILRGVVAAICLLPPTVLMGATLPAIARWVESSERDTSWLGFFYGGNIVGAVLGSITAGFYLLRVHDGIYATIVAAILNALVAFIAWTFAQAVPYTASTKPYDAVTEPMVADARSIYVAIAISGATALAGEVVWTRLLSLTFGASTYTFSMILAVFLAGLGLGSSVAAWLAKVIESPRRAFAWTQFLLTLAIAWAAVTIYVAMPNWPINPSLAPSPWFTLQLDLARCALAVFPAAVLWGASFPFALAALTRPGQDASRLIARLYSANTVGAILGSVICSILLIPLFGTQDAQRVLIALSAVSALVLFVSRRRVEAKGMSPAAATAPLVLVPAMALALILSLPQVPGMLVAYGRYAVTWLGRLDVLYTGEGMNSSVAVSKMRSNNAIQFHVSGKVEASSLPQDMRLQRMLAHLPALVHPNPRSVLVVGFGAGVTAGSFIPYPTLQRLVICEIEPLVPKVVSTWFSHENNSVATNPRTEIVYDDARSFVLTSDEKFDIITSDPINPWVKGAASLYTREYFTAVKEHLNPGGVVTQWVPLYESTVDAVRSELATFFEVFPNGTIWANNLDGAGYDLVLLAQEGATTIDVAEIERKLADAKYVPVLSSLAGVGFTSPFSLFATFAGRGADMKDWLRGAEINTDRNLRLQYLAGVGINQYTEASIFNEMVRYRRFPAGLFVGDTLFARQMESTLGSAH